MLGNICQVGVRMGMCRLLGLIANKDIMTQNSCVKEPEL